MNVAPSGPTGPTNRLSAPLRATIVCLLGLALLASGCGAVGGRLTATDRTSTIPDGPSATAQPANNGTANIEVLDTPANEAIAPGGSNPTEQTEDTGQTGQAAGINGSAAAEIASADSSQPADLNSAASRYSVVAQATVPTVTARTAPDASAEAVAAFTNPTASGSPLVFRSVDSPGTVSNDWIEVQLPIQPNGSTGWIPRSEVALSDNPYRVEVSRADYSLRVYHLNQVWIETPIAVGTGNTPTPVGEFYLLELLAPPDPTGPYGPFAFGLSGFSEVLTSFGGADTAIIGLHGTNDPTSLGTDVSHGCIRLENQVIEQLAEVLPLGTPVRIT